MSSDLVIKKWGWERILHNAEFCAKVMGLDQGFQCSVHFHAVKKEMFIVTKGAIRVELWDRLCPETTECCPGIIDCAHPDKILILDYAYSAGANIYIDNFVPHRFIGLGKQNEFIETSTHDDPEDSYRFNSSRKPDNR
jgi:uncharacterized RmlC-like cupin family protein